jgi:hypothetical protein
MLAGAVWGAATSAEHAGASGLRQGGRGAWWGEGGASPDSPSAGAGDDKSHERERLTRRLHGLWLGFRVAGTNEPNDQGGSETVRSQGRIGHSGLGLGEQLQGAALLDRQVRTRH